MKARAPYVVALQRAATLDTPKLTPAQVAKSKAAATSIFDRIHKMRAAQVEQAEAVA
jgi:hypothetical protein